jgi:hypothetical protein
MAAQLDEMEGIVSQCSTEMRKQRLSHADELAENINNLNQ